MDHRAVMLLHWRDLVAGEVRHALAAIVNRLSEELCDRAFHEGGNVADSPHLDAARDLRLRQGELVLRFEGHLSVLFDEMLCPPCAGRPEDRLGDTLRAACARALADMNAPSATRQAVVGGLETFLDLELPALARMATDAAAAADAPAGRAPPSMRARRQLEGCMDRRKVPHFVRAFLLDQWSRLLDRIAAEEGEGSMEWRRAMNTAEELLAAVQDLCSDASSRDRLWALPRLVHSLRRGMRRVPVSLQEEMLFLRTLRTWHLRTAGFGSPPDMLDS
jgi:hypothetical protein